MVSSNDAREYSIFRNLDHARSQGQELVMQQKDQDLFKTRDFFIPGPQQDSPQKVSVREMDVESKVNLLRGILIPSGSLSNLPLPGLSRH